MRADFIGPADPRWAELVGRVPHDVYHLPEYAEASSAAEGGRPLAYLAESGAAACLIPLIVRDLPEELGAAGWRDATSPYGYAGPIVSPGTTPVELAGLLAAFRAAGAAAGLVSAFIRLHPLLPLPPAALGVVGTVRGRGPVVVVDLARPPAEIWADTRENHRTGIRKLERRGYRAALDDWAHFPDFVQVYEATMRRVAASPFYFFGPAYYDALRARLGGRLHLCTILAPDGRVACAGLFFEEAGIVQYHLGGTADEFLSVAPSKLMFDVVRRWARDRDNRVLHLGGGAGGREDSLFHCKAGFSPLRAEFRSLEVIFDAERYRLLVERCGTEEGDEAGYFPAYRAPTLLARR